MSADSSPAPRARLRRIGARVARAFPPSRRILADRSRLRRQLDKALKRQNELERTVARRKERHEAAMARIVARLNESKSLNDRLLAQSAGLVRADAGDRDLDYLFIATYGRSGSTLLQAILNTTPGYLIRGENRDVLNHLFAYHRQLRTEAEEHRDTAYSQLSPWWGIGQYAAEASVSGLRKLFVETVLRPEADTRVVGFKEIRWWHHDWHGYQDFLLELFPGARFVVLTRDHAAVAKSKWWQEDPEAPAKLRRFEDRLTAIADRLGPERSFRIHYDDFAADPAQLEPLFGWLGEPFDLPKITEAMGRRYSY